MIPDYIIRTGWFFLLLFLQISVFNHVHVVGFATPMPIVFFLIMLSSATPRWVYVLLGFLSGFIVDMFASTPGMHAASLTLTGLLTPPVLQFFLPADFEKGDTLLPSHKTLEWGKFIRFASVVTLIAVASFYTIEMFTFVDMQHLILCISGSWLLTLLFILAFEYIRTAKK